MNPIEVQQYTHHLPIRNGYIVDARIAWWKVQSRQPAIVLTVSGELDASNADSFDSSIQNVAAVGDPFVVDLTGVSHIGAQVIRTLIGVDAATRSAGTRWAVVVNQPTRRLFENLGLNSNLPLTSTCSEALRDVAASKGTVLRLVSGGKRGKCEG